MDKNNLPPCMIYIDKEGKWFHKGLEMIHKGIINDFYRDLSVTDTGEYIISRGSEKCFVEVEDTPFIVTRTEYKEDKNQFLIYLIDDTAEKLDPETIEVGNRNVLYCRVKNRKFKARFSRAAYYQFAEHIKEEGDKYYLPLNNKKYFIEY